MHNRLQTRWRLHHKKIKGGCGPHKRGQFRMRAELDVTRPVIRAAGDRPDIKNCKRAGKRSRPGLEKRAIGPFICAKRDAEPPNRAPRKTYYSLAWPACRTRTRPRLPYHALQTRAPRRLKGGRGMGSAPPDRWDPRSQTLGTQSDLRSVRPSGKIY